MIKYIFKLYQDYKAMQYEKAWIQARQKQITKINKLK